MANPTPRKLSVRISIAPLVPELAVRRCRSGRARYRRIAFGRSSTTYSRSRRCGIPPLQRPCAASSMDNLLGCRHLPSSSRTSCQRSRLWLSTPRDGDGLREKCVGSDVRKPVFLSVLEDSSGRSLYLLHPDHFWTDGPCAVVSSHQRIASDIVRAAWLGDMGFDGVRNPPRVFSLGRSRSLHPQGS